MKCEIFKQMDIENLLVQKKIITEKEKEKK